MRISWRICRSYRLIIVAAALAAIVATVWCVDPNDALWMPKCPVKVLTGYDCPGCGATRALHAFLHGDITAAIRYNFFLVAGIGYAALVAAATWLPCARRHERLRRAILGRTAGWIYITLFFAWWIVRNVLGI